VFFEHKAKSNSGTVGESSDDTMGYIIPWQLIYIVKSATDRIGGTTDRAGIVTSKFKTPKVGSNNLYRK